MLINLLFHLQLQLFLYHCFGSYVRIFTGPFFPNHFFHTKILLVVIYNLCNRYSLGSVLTDLKNNKENWKTGCEKRDLVRTMELRICLLHTIFVNHFRVNLLQNAKREFFLWTWTIYWINIHFLHIFFVCIDISITVGSKIIRALAIVLAIFLWFDWNLLTFHACYK